MSQVGGFCAGDEEEDGEGWIRDRRRCLPASLLAQWTLRSHASHSVASSAQQKTEAASAAHTSHCTFMPRSAQAQVAGTGRAERSMEGGVRER